MRAFVLTGPREGGVEWVERPVAGSGEVVVDVERVGICGTDVEFFTGDMAYLHSGHAEYPLRLGHEWCGTVSAIGAAVDAAWLGRRVTGDTMLGCGECELCLRGRQHVCERRFEIGIRGGWPGALAEQLRVPASALRALPDGMTAAAGALVEPGGNALRAVEATATGPGDDVAIWGAGSIGLLATAFVVMTGARAHVVDPRDAARELALEFGATIALRPDEVSRERLPSVDAVIDAATDPGTPAHALRLVEPGGRVVCIGLSSEPTPIDTRDLVLRDVTVVGILSASPGLTRTIEHYAAGRVVPDALVAEVIGLDQVLSRLGGERGADAGPGPKIQVDPRR